MRGRCLLCSWSLHWSDQWDWFSWLAALSLLLGCFQWAARQKAVICNKAIEMTEVMHCNKHWRAEVGGSTHMIWLESDFVKDKTPDLTLTWYSWLETWLRLETDDLKGSDIWYFYEILAFFWIVTGSNMVISSAMSANLAKHKDTADQHEAAILDGSSPKIIRFGSRDKFVVDVKRGQHRALQLKNQWHIVSFCQTYWLFKF